MRKTINILGLDWNKVLKALYEAAKPEDPANMMSDNSPPTQPKPSDAENNNEVYYSTINMGAGIKFLGIRFNSETSELDVSEFDKRYSAIGSSLAEQTIDKLRADLAKRSRDDPSRLSVTDTPPPTPPILPSTPHFGSPLSSPASSSSRSSSASVSSSRGSLSSDSGSLSSDTSFTLPPPATTSQDTPPPLGRLAAILGSGPFARPTR